MKNFPYYQTSNFHIIKKKAQSFDNGDVINTLFLSLHDTQLIFAKKKGTCQVNRFAGGMMLSITLWKI